MSYPRARRCGGRWNLSGPPGPYRAAWRSPSTGWSGAPASSRRSTKYAKPIASPLLASRRSTTWSTGSRATRCRPLMSRRSAATASAMESEAKIMCDRTERIATIMAASLAASVRVSGLALPDPAYAQQSKGTNRIVCWKDKAGKVVGCGDKVPPEYQDAATREMDRGGVTRKHTESAEETRRRVEKEQEAAKSNADAERRALEQRRQDQALLATFSNEKEIDLKRDRDLAALDQQIEQLSGAIKNATVRHGEIAAQSAILEKNKKALPPATKDEFVRVTAE